MRLEKQRVLLGRNAADVVFLETALRSDGAEVCCIPLIEVHSIPSTQYQPLPHPIDIVFVTSGNAIASYLELRQNLDPHFLAVVGKKTAMPLLQENIMPDVTGDGTGALALLRQLSQTVDLRGKHILYPCSTLAGKELVGQAEKMGCTVHMIPVYENRKPANLSEEQLRGFSVAVFLFSYTGII